jgi:tRNA(adenine34) deaminase
MTFEPELGEWVGLALVEARAALAAGEPPVGAIVVDPLGQVIAAARNRREDDADPTAHAEIVALRGAGRVVGGWRLEGCVLAVTLEPCPMCAGAAVAARVGRVVFGAWDPKAGAAGSVWDLVRDRRAVHRPEVIGGVREAECAALLSGFFAARRGASSGP